MRANECRIVVACRLILISGRRSGEKVHYVVTFATLHLARTSFALLLIHGYEVFVNVIGDGLS